MLGRALRYGNISGGKESGESADSAPVDYLLGCVAVSTCSKYMDQLTTIQGLPNNSARQLAVDIGSISNYIDFWVLCFFRRPKITLKNIRICMVILINSGIKPF